MKLSFGNFLTVIKLIFKSIYKAKRVYFISQVLIIAWRINDEVKRRTVKKVFLRKIIKNITTPHQIPCHVLTRYPEFQRFLRETFKNL